MNNKSMPEITELDFEAEGEKALLSCLMRDPVTHVRKLATALLLEAFHRPGHRWICEAIVEVAADGLFYENGVVDLNAVADRLRERGKLKEAGGKRYLADVLDSQCSAANFDYYAERVQEHWTLRRIRSELAGMADDAKTPGHIAEKKAAIRERAEKLARLCSGTDSGITLEFVNMATVTAEAIEWLWFNRFPLGTLSMLSGDAGVGKSLLTIRMAVHITTGRAWPDLPATPVLQGSVVFIGEEDDPAKIIRPRLDAAGVDARRVEVLRGVRVHGGQAAGFDITAHLGGLEAAIKKLKECRMIVIDPITQYLGNVNANSNAEVRAALAPVAELARRLNLAIIGLNHHNKRADLSYKYRGLGSTAFVAAARSVWAVLEDKEDSDRRIFAPIKANYSVKPQGMTFRIKDNAIVFDTEPWRGHIDEQICSRPDTGAVQAAGEWLQDRLEGGAVAQKTLEDEAVTAGINVKTLRRAKGKIGVKASRVGFGAEGRWMWQLPT